MEKTQKTFAFRLANQEQAKNSEVREDKWKIRDGVAVAGCSDPMHQANFRYHRFPGIFDNGAWC